MNCFNSAGLFLLLAAAAITTTEGFLGITQARVYGRCFQFDIGKVLFSPSVCHFCASTNKFALCRTYKCVQINCTETISSGCCQACPGTCNYGGNIYNHGDTFTCIDGVSQCQCTDFGHIDIIKIQQIDLKKLCGVKENKISVLYD